MTDRLVRRGSKVCGSHERIDVIDLHAAGADTVGGLDDCDGELAMRRLARDEDVVASAERNPDFHDGVRVASELLGRQ